MGVKKGQEMFSHSKSILAILTSLLSPRTEHSAPAHRWILSRGHTPELYEAIDSVIAHLDATTPKEDLQGSELGAKLLTLRIQLHLARANDASDIRFSNSVLETLNALSNYVTLLRDQRRVYLKRFTWIALVTGVLSVSGGLVAIFCKQPLTTPMIIATVLCGLAVLVAIWGFSVAWFTSRAMAPIYQLFILEEDKK